VDSEQVYLAIRPEDIEIVGTTINAADCVASNIIEVKAELITFLGAVVDITVNLGGREMIVDIAQKEFAKKPIKKQETIQLYFPPDAFHIYSEFFKKLI
jgi:ABC-type Fe3+/spermidine/putrescine transport system ATPase subunit